MPTWSGILEELNNSRVGNNPPDFDAVRRKYLVALQQHTGRDIILYASKFTQAGLNVSPEFISIVDEDLQGIMEVIHGLSGPNLDLILHSPGGSIEAAEALMLYLRSKFTHVRVIVPQMAMSAATMVACAADVIVLGKHSFLGPIDPQIMIDTPLGRRMVPAQAILEQFDRAKDECRDPSKMGAWLPMLAQYGPDLLVQCENASRMSFELVQNWLETHMFKGRRDRKRRAGRIAEWLSDHGHFKSHGRHIPRSELERKGLEVYYLETDQKEQDLFLSVFHAATHTFNGTPAVKIIENHMGKAFIKQAQIFQVPGPPVRPGDGPGILVEGAPREEHAAVPQPAGKPRKKAKTKKRKRTKK